MIARLKIPVVAFILSVICGAVVNHFHENAVADFVNRAGVEGWPIIHVNTETGDWLYTLDGSYIHLGHSLYTIPLTTELTFDRSGRIHGQNRRGYYYGTYANYVLELPNINMRSIGVTDSDEGEIPGQLTASESPWRDQRAVVVDDGETVYIENSYTHVIYDVPVPDDLNLEALRADPGIYRGGFTRDGKSFFIYGASATPDLGVWRIDLDSRESVKITDQSAQIIDATSYGDLILVYNSGKAGGIRSIEVRDGHTFDIVHTLSYDIFYRTSEHWLARVDPRWGLPTHLILNDTNDGFKEYRIKLVDVIRFWRFRYYELTIYEPPPNGLDGMNDNYIPDEE